MIEGLEKKGTVRWSGEHWISYLRRPGEDSNTGMVSLYNMRYTEAGHGFASFVVIHEDGGEGFKGSRGRRFHGRGGHPPRESSALR